MKFELYKIYNPQLDQYAQSGSDMGTYRWGKNGRTWTGIANIKSHITYIGKMYLPTTYYTTRETDWIYKDCLVIKITQDGTDEIKMTDFMQIMPIYLKLVNLKGKDWL